MAGVGAAAPHIDRYEQEQPHHVNEVPIPSRRLEAKVLLGREMPADARIRHTNRKMVPTSTWKPWKRSP